MFTLKKTGLLFASLGLSLNAFSQVVINEVQPSTGKIELKNTGTTTVNISDWYLCAIAGGANYQQINSLTTESGDATALEAGEILVLSGRTFQDSDELGLYATNSFNSSAAIRDYLRWGSPAAGRSGVAEGAGIWIASEALPSISNDDSIEYDGEGNALTDYGVTSENTLGKENKNTCSHGIAYGANVYTTNDQETVIAVAQSELARFQVKNTSTAGLSYWYIITDSEDNIIKWVNSNGAATTEIDLTEAEAGECRVWGWSYRGLSDPIVGEHISTLSDDACESISKNWVTVIREVPNGGTVSTYDDKTEVALVALTEYAKVRVKHTNTAENLSYWYIVTDSDDNIIKWVNPKNLDDPTNVVIDFSTVDPGECHIWGWSYRGLSNPVVGENISTLDDHAQEEVSSNSITVFRQVPNGGTVSTVNNETEITVTAGTDEAIIAVQHNNTADKLSYWYIVTDSDDNIIKWVNPKILEDPSNVTVDLSEAPAGECRIWGWSYRGLANPVLGDPITSLDDDAREDVSTNYIKVTRIADNTAGLFNSLVNSALQVYPVPAENVLNIKNNDVSLVKVYSLAGKELISSKSNKVNTSELNSGVYLVKVTSVQGEVSVARFSKK